MRDHDAAPSTSDHSSADDEPDFMALDRFAPIALTYDDVLLLPGETDVIPSEVDTTARLTRDIDVAMPLVSAAMDTVTEARMAIAMARQGGIGVLHRNLSIEDQAQQVVTVKRSESGMITDPVTVGPDATLAELDALCARYRVSALLAERQSDLPLVNAARVLAQRDASYHVDNSSVALTADFLESIYRMAAGELPGEDDFFIAGASACRVPDGHSADP